MMRCLFYPTDEAATTVSFCCCSCFCECSKALGKWHNLFIGDLSVYSLVASNMEFLYGGVKMGVHENEERGG